ncbi:NAD(P)/FAD-dependent oxidoreductase [Aestuariivirga sp.]|uniref:NAD(P)/FAD-dependent oxidoreductase n=1 Tax=Aestuariivirga sp. TaxID=2650926 RepID=UPI0039E717E2
MPVITSVSSDITLPKEAAVCVIGGGIAGVATTLELAERGVDVVLLEKGEIAAEQSSRNWGWCRQMGRDPREIPLILQALDLWRGMNRRINGDTGFTECGIVYLCDSDAALARREAWYGEYAKPFGLSSRLVSAAEAASLMPGSAVAWKGGLYTANDGRAEPFIAVPAMAEAARRKGAKLFTRCAVRGLETKAGRISSVVTEKGVIACDTVVLAGGVWSRRFCGNLGIELPQLGIINSAMRTEPIDTGLTHTASAAKFAIRKRADGGFTVAHSHLSTADITPDSFRLFGHFLPALKTQLGGLRLRLGKRFIDEARLARRWNLDEVSPFEQVRIMDPEPERAILDQAETSLKAHFPAFQPMKIAERWAGLIDVTPDAVPVISPVEKLPGFFIATGLSGHGFGLGPGVGKLMAELVTGETPCVDPSAFRHSRYFDGSNPKIIAGF